MMRLDFEDKTFRFWLKDGRSFELSWGLGPIAVSIDEAHINLAFLFFRVFIPYFGSKHNDDINVNKYWEYGINIYRQDFTICYGWMAGVGDDKYKTFTWPWSDWVHVSTLKGASSDHPYCYSLTSGVKQEVTATIHEEISCWELRWLPFIKRTWRGIDVKFSGELGEGMGTWKGGTVGCAFSMKKEERPIDALRRMEETRKF